MDQVTLNPKPQTIRSRAAVGIRAGVHGLLGAGSHFPWRHEQSGKRFERAGQPEGCSEGLAGDLYRRHQTIILGPMHRAQLSISGL
jgi:hypothetical protein